MIHIIRDQELMGNPNLKVASPTGNYEDTALIDFYNIYNPEIIAGAFQAQFVKYGGMVYQFNEPKELGEEILKIDPESTHSSAVFSKMNNELINQIKKGELEPDFLQKIKEDNISEENIEEEYQENEIIQEENVDETKNYETKFNKETQTQIDNTIQESNEENLKTNEEILE